MAHKSFAEFNTEVGTRKTGYYGYGVDMYTMRTGSKERVFRVQWYERNPKYPTHEDYKRALRRARNYINEWIEKNEVFPYTPEGLDEAIRFSESVQPKRDEFISQNQ